MYPEPLEHSRSPHRLETKNMTSRLMWISLLGLGLAACSGGAPVDPGAGGGGAGSTGGTGGTGNNGGTGGYNPNLYASPPQGPPHTSPPPKTPPANNGGGNGNNGGNGNGNGH